MAQSAQRSAMKAALDHIIGDRRSAVLSDDIQMLLINMLTPFIEDASIRLKSGERISIDEKREIPTQIHYDNEPLPSATVNAKDIVNKLVGMETVERAELLSTFEERDFKTFLEQSNDLEQLQSIQYLFTRRINNLKGEERRQSPRRPVIEQRKVGGYLYKLQATQKGDSYWYIQFTKEGKRVHKYLGKARPSFNPQEDLAKTEGRKFLSAHS